MYCTTKVRFYCDGEREQALAKFQAVFDDLAAMLKARHPDITAPDLSEPVIDDDVHEGIDSESDLDHPARSARTMP